MSQSGTVELRPDEDAPGSGDILELGLTAILLNRRLFRLALGPVVVVTGRRFVVELRRLELREDAQLISDGVMELDRASIWSTEVRRTVSFRDDRRLRELEPELGTFAVPEITSCAL